MATRATTCPALRGVGEREQLEALVRAKMGGAYLLDVPLEVSSGYGPSWDTTADERRSQSRGG
jgi:hypothetical protein